MAERDEVTARDYEILKKQILEIRETGLTNMLDVHEVQRLAYERGLFLLVTFLGTGEGKKEYAKFILDGEFE